MGGIIEFVRKRRKKAILDIGWLLLIGEWRFQNARYLMFRKHNNERKSE
jgi:hypothetical protein